MQTFQPLAATAKSQGSRAQHLELTVESGHWPQARKNSDFARKLHIQRIANMDWNNLQILEKMKILSSWSH